MSPVDFEGENHMKRQLRGLGCVLALAFAVLAVFGATSAFSATAAPGYAVTNWVTGAANTGFFGVGPIGIAADPTVTVQVVCRVRGGVVESVGCGAG